LDDFVSAYIDDILIFSHGTRSDHRDKVKKVLQKLQDAGLQVDIDKCCFEVQKVKYLGFIIEAGKGIAMDPEKVAAIQAWEAPKSVKGVRSFLGFGNYYRAFIDRYSDIVAPLIALTKKSAPSPFRLTPQARDAFERLKDLFSKEPILAQFDWEKDTILEADSSGYATGGVLSQFDDNGTLKPYAFYSKKNSPAESNYEIHDKELLAIIRCLEEWDAELRSLARPFIIYSDHRNLQYFMKKQRLNERQIR